MSSSIKVIKEQNIIDLENIVVQFPSRDGSLFGRKKIHCGKQCESWY